MPSFVDTGDESNATVIYPTASRSRYVRMITWERYILLLSIAVLMFITALLFTVPAKSLNLLFWAFLLSLALSSVLAYSHMLSLRWKIKITPSGIYAPFVKIRDRRTLWSMEFIEIEYDMIERITQNPVFSIKYGLFEKARRDVQFPRALAFKLKNGKTYMLEFLHSGATFFVDPDDVVKLILETSGFDIPVERYELQKEMYDPISRNHPLIKFES